MISFHLLRNIVRPSPTRAITMGSPVMTRNTALILSLPGLLLAASVLAQPGNPNQRSIDQAFYQAPDARAGLLWKTNGPRIDSTPDDITTYDYDSVTLGISSMTNALGQVVTMSNHNDRGMPAQVTGLNGHVTTFSYHPMGWVSSVTAEHSSGNATQTIQYDGNGNVTCTTSAEGVRTRFLYTGANEIQTIYTGVSGCSQTDGPSIVYEVDAKGNRTAERYYAQDGTLTFERIQRFDELGRLREVELPDADGDGFPEITMYGYDRNDALRSETNPKAGLTEYGRDALGRVDSEENPIQNQPAAGDDPGIPVDYDYSASDQVTSVTDPNNHTTYYDYDFAGNRTLVDSPDTGQTQYRHDEAGNIVYRKDARGVEVWYTYDALNRLTTVDYPAPGAGEVNEDVIYSYDNGAVGCNTVGRLYNVSWADGARSIDYCYDHRGNITSKTVTLDGESSQSRYQYDKDNKLSKIIYPTIKTLAGGDAGHTIACYFYDAAGRVSSIQADFVATTVTACPSRVLVDAISYYPFGPIKSMRYGNGPGQGLGTTIERVYDKAYRLKTATVTRGDGSALMAYAYAYDRNGNITAIDTTQYDAQGLATTTTASYQYDGLDRLRSELNALLGTSAYRAFTYDPVGNRKSLDVGSSDTLIDQSIDYQYAATSNRLATITDAAASQSVTHSYDAVGNILSPLHHAGDMPISLQVPMQDSYGVSNRRLSTTFTRYEGNHALSYQLNYAYTPEGQRIRKLTTLVDVENDGVDITQWDHSNQAHFTYGLAGEMLVDDQYHYKAETLNGTPTGQTVAEKQVRQWIYLNGMPVVQLSGVEATGVNTLGAPVVTYHYNDHLGVARMGLSQAGNLSYEATRSAFGGEWHEVLYDVAQGQLSNPSRFPGQYVDGESGVFYNYHRDYDSVSGRYFQGDPIGIRGGLNLFLYTMANPLMFLDIYGLNPNCRSWECEAMPPTYNCSFVEECMDRLDKWKEFVEDLMPDKDDGDEESKDRKKDKNEKIVDQMKDLLKDLRNETLKNMMCGAMNYDLCDGKDGKQFPPSPEEIFNNGVNGEQCK